MSAIHLEMHVKHKMGPGQGAQLVEHRPDGPRWRV